MPRLFLALVALLVSTNVWAGGPTGSAEQKIRAQLSDMQISSITAVREIPGLYEIVAGGNIFYVDGNGRYLINGHLFDTASKRDLTAKRLEEVNRVSWSSLPLKKAVVSGDANDTPIAVFTDPDCPYCRQLEQELAKVKGVKIYSFLYPLTQLHPKAMAHATGIWCAKDQDEMMRKVMVGNADIPAGTCANPINDIIALADQLGIYGTPAIISMDGRKHSGVMKSNQILNWANNK